MNALVRLLRSSVGKKFLMAVTGIGLVLFVVGHLVGNLQIFLGREAINRYAALLHSNTELLWAVRLGLLAMVGLHVWSAAQLTRENRRARPLDYAGAPAPAAASYASRTMLMSGLIVAAFVVFHLLHFTAQVPAVNLTGQDFRTFQEATGEAGGRHDVFKMMIVGFRQPVVSLFYVVGVGLLCLHLSHGVRAMFQSLGWLSPRCIPFTVRLGQGVAWAVFLGYVSIPVAVLLGYGKAVLN